MRNSLLFCLLGWQVLASDQVYAQAANDAAQWPPSLGNVPHNTAFCYGIHNGAEFATMLLGSELVLQLAQSGASSISVEAISESLGSEFELGDISFGLSEATEQANDVTQQQRSDLSDLARQLFARDAIVIGDESWSTTWESISKSVLIAKENLSLVEKEANSYTIEGIDALLADESFAKIRIPDTVLSFQLTDTSPATRLLDQLSISVGDAMPETLAGWKYYRHAIEADSLAVFSYSLRDGLIAVTDEDDMDAKEKSEHEKLLGILRDRSFQFGIGLVKSRLVIFVGEDIQRVADLIDVGANQTKRLVARNELASVVPAPEEILIASAYVSDRYAKSADVLGNQGLLSNLTSFVSNLGGMVKVGDVPIDQAAIGMGIPSAAWTQLGSKLKWLGERWDALVPPNAGWAATISASPSGIVGRSVTMTIDPRLPVTALTVEQHLGDDVIAFYARQGTTSAERCLLAYEFASQSMIGFTKLMITFADEEEISENVDLHFGRLNQMPLRLTKIVNESLLPALGDGGQAIVLTRLDPTPNEHDNVPIEVSFVSTVANRQALVDAGEMIRQWANSLVNQYCEIIKKMDPDEADMDVPTLPPPMVTDDGDSNLFTLAALTSEADSVDDADAAKDAPAVSADWDISSIGTMFHWRLSDDVLAMGTNIVITKNMLKPKRPVSPNRGLGDIDGVLRSIIWIDTDQIAKMYEGIDDEDAQSFAKIVHCIDSYHRVTTTNNRKT
ncbi:MAG: hypothetical protein WBD20_10705, partial [Pirellulaceae bacterium]